MSSEKSSMSKSVDNSGQGEISRGHPRDKDIEAAKLGDRSRPLRLLDLPVDILESIIKHFTHTNDLTSLAQTHSALHALVIPHIYSRFDIVWPDVQPEVDSRIGVDALTYGLATLVMAPDVLAESHNQHQSIQPVYKCGQCQLPDQCHHISRKPMSRKIRRGNHFAEHTRKFSLGNGPPALVQDYAITKEAGKMLGTLVALAVGRMRNLEAFIWDMPTGVLRDVWLALASLGDREDGQTCRLDRVWVRWHDNSERALMRDHSTAIPTLIDQSHTAGVQSAQTGLLQHSLFAIPPYPRVEFPTFSVLPPLRSLSVLDIDELPYAEEMSVLIENSIHKLEELRLGVAEHAQFDLWLTPAEDRVLTNPRVPSLTTQTTKSGGILGIILNKCCDQSRARRPSEECDLPSIVNPSTQIPASSNPQHGLSESSISEMSADDEGKDPPSHFADGGVAVQDLKQGGEDRLDDQLENLSSRFADQNLIDDPSPSLLSHPASSSVHASHPPNDENVSTDSVPSLNCLFGDESPGFTAPSRKLRLRALELERVPLSVTTLSQAVDWSRLTTLSILGCKNHEQLWKAMKKRFTPVLSVSRPRNSSVSTMTVRKGVEYIFNPSQIPSTYSNVSSKRSTSDYYLQIRRLHTDNVSPALISFIRDALAPDSLEWLFLQTNSSYKSNVTIDVIYKGAIRRHRSSLTKLLVDSGHRRSPSELEAPAPNPTTATNHNSDSHWRHWVYNRELLTAITNGRMPNLRELSLSIDYKDWHFFLQRLPHARELRALHVAHIADHVQGRVNPGEAALQILDIVALRPELQLVYLGVQNECFEILEYPVKKKAVGKQSTPAGGAVSAMLGESENATIDNDADSDDANEDSSGGTPGGNIADPHDAEDEDESDDGRAGSIIGETTDDEDEEFSQACGKDAKTFRLRKILFYDDKVAIFKARHGRL